MKKSLFTLTVVMGLLLQSCFFQNDFGTTEVVKNYEPVVLKRSVFETTTALENTSRAIENSGKIYVKGNYIFINEVNKGFHVIDNTDPENPNNIGFIKVLGSTDLSIKNDVYYVNNATDMVAFKIDLVTETVTITKRIINVFPQLWSPEGISANDLAEDDVVVDWEPVN